MGAISHSEPRVNLSHSVPPFDGAPFLATRLETDLCNVTLLPRAPIHELLDFAFLQSTRNGLLSVLVLDEDSCVSLERNGRIQPGRTQPVDTRIAPAFTGGRVTARPLPLECRKTTPSESLR